MTEEQRRRTVGDAFGGRRTTLEEQRAIWPEALHPDIVWEFPTFDPPIQLIGLEAVGRFLELLLEVVPEFSTRALAVYPTPDPDTFISESVGGGETVDGGRYEQRYFSLVTRRDGQGYRIREYCNPFRTLEAFGAERWNARVAQITAELNGPWPASQPPMPA